jgi:hypothetical protein
MGPAAVALAGWVDDQGLKVEKPGPCKTRAGELRPKNCVPMRGSTWAVVTLVVENTGKEPWVPTWAELTPTASGEPRKARAVLPLNGIIPPGESASIAVEVELPRSNQDWFSQSYTLTLCDAAGRCLTVLDLKL